VNKGRFYGFGLVGAVVVGVSIAMVAWLGYGFGQIGSCSSTGRLSNGRSVRTCTSSETLRIILIFPAVWGGVLGLFLAGRRARRRDRTPTFGLAVWVVGYLVVGTALAASAFDPANESRGGDRWGWAIPGFIFVPQGLAGIVFGVVRSARAAKARDLVATGVRAPAVIQAISFTGVTVNEQPRVEIDLEVRPAAGSPFAASKTCLVSRFDPPRVGDEVVVWYDADDPSSFALDLSHRRPAAGAHGLTEELERLGALHQQGLLTDAELAQAKARVLGGS
jgi:hypothetical protein